MSSNDKPLHDNRQNIFDFEWKIREKLEELNWKTEALEDAKKEVSTLHTQVAEQQLTIEDERRKIAELEKKLHSLFELNQVLEKQNASNNSERNQLHVNYDLILKERNSLLEQNRSLKAENMRLTREVQKQNDKEAMTNIKQKGMEQSFHHLRDEILNIMESVGSNVSKLSKEQDYLRKSVDGVIRLNKRLKTIVSSMHNHYKTQETCIQSLQQKLASTMYAKPPPTMEQTLADRIPQSESQINLNLSELKLQQQDLEKQLSNIFHELDFFEQRETGDFDPTKDLR